MNKKNQSIGVLGSGIVGQTLANGLRVAGYDVMIGNRTAKPVDNWDGAVGTFGEVAKSADILILSVKGSVAESVVESIKDLIANKTIIDTTNPISDSPPEDGVISYFTKPNQSLMERLQKIAPAAHFVKAFNSVGNAIMINPKFKAGKPTMFICGNDQSSKQTTTKILQELGWEIADMGGVKSARAIEPLCILWCIPGMLDNQWSHAFKLLKE